MQNSAIIKYVIADDHTLLRQGLVSLIESRRNYQLLYSASNGQDLVDHLDPNNLPDIAILDTQMPVMDGFATIVWLQEHFPSIKILMLTMMENDTTIIKALKLGARGYLLKDSEPAEFFAAIDSVVEKGFYYNEFITQRIVHSLRQHVNDESRVPAKESLTPREMEVLQLLASEKTYKEIAEEMFVSPRTIDGIRDALFVKLNVKSRVGLVIYGIKNGLIKI